MLVLRSFIPPKGSAARTLRESVSHQPRPILVSSGKDYSTSVTLVTVPWSGFAHRSNNFGPHPPTA